MFFVFINSYSREIFDIFDLYIKNLANAWKYIPIHKYTKYTDFNKKCNSLLSNLLSNFYEIFKITTI